MPDAIARQDRQGTPNSKRCFNQSGLCASACEPHRQFERDERAPCRERVILPTGDCSSHRHSSETRSDRDCLNAIFTTTLCASASQNRRGHGEATSLPQPVGAIDDSATSSALAGGPADAARRPRRLGGAARPHLVGAAAGISLNIDTRVD